MRILFFILLFFSLTSYGSNIEQIRKKLFTSHINTPICITVSRGLKSDLFAPDVNKIIDNLMKDLSDRNSSGLAKLFHPKLKITASYIKYVIFQAFKNFYKKPLSFSIYRIWALNTKGDKVPVIVCPKDNLSLSPHYGYPMQFAIWIQIMGSAELGRIYTTLVPVGDTWKLGVWIMQQWTFNGKDADTWVKQALDDAAAHNKFKAYIKLDIAQKLLTWKGYLATQTEQNIIATKNSYFPKDAWLESIKKITSNIVYASSFFAKDGPGLLLRFEVPKDLFPERAQLMCKKNAKKIYKTFHLTDMGGTKCSFIIKGEDIHKDGYKGSKFFGRVDILEK